MKSTFQKSGCFWFNSHQYQLFENIIPFAKGKGRFHPFMIHEHQTQDSQDKSTTQALFVFWYKEVKRLVMK